MHFHYGIKLKSRDWFLWDWDDGGLLETYGDYGQEQGRVKDVGEDALRARPGILSCPVALCAFTFLTHICLRQLKWAVILL